jgi:phospholipase A1
MLDRNRICRVAASAALVVGTFPFAASGAEPEQPRTILTRLWDLDHHEGKARFSGYRPMYFLAARVTDDVNEAPYEEDAGEGEPAIHLQNVEAKFQISLKWKFAQGIFRDHADFWVGYTQQSHWQIYNPEASRPFRETNYEPEAMLVFPTSFRFLGMDGRFARVGFVHQSNGRSEPLSRSWNRIYGQVGLERGRFALTVRPWWRIDGGGEDDDNPDIEDYLGRIEFVGVHDFGKHVVNWTARSNLRLDPARGSLQVEWILPLHENLRGYVQAFTGYGESLIDYDHRQTTIGVGVLVFSWL